MSKRKKVERVRHLPTSILERGGERYLRGPRSVASRSTSSTAVRSGIVLGGSLVYCSCSRNETCALRFSSCVIVSSPCSRPETELRCVHGRFRLGAGSRRCSDDCDRIGTPVVPSTGCRKIGRPDALRSDQGEGRLPPITRQRGHPHRRRIRTSVHVPSTQKPKLRIHQPTSPRDSA